MHRLIEKSGEEGFSQHVIDILAAPFTDGLVSIKPNGTVFISHPHYRNRLDAAFGVGGWCLVPLDKPHVQGNRVVWYGFLKAGGRYIESAYGGCTLPRNNYDMTYDDCVEGAKSDCLTRCCKALPMFRDLWNKEYADYWKATYAEEGRDPRYPDKPYWKKIGEAVRGWTARPDKAAQSEFRKPPRVEDENQAHMDALRREAKALIAVPNTEWGEDELADDGRED